MATVGSQKGLLSKICSILLSTTHIPDPLELHWEQALKQDISDLTWERINAFNYNLSLNIGLRESRYKLTLCWYLTPKLLSKIYLDTTDVRWACGYTSVSYIHLDGNVNMFVPFENE